MKFTATSAAVLLASIDAVSAQAAAWAQCGGNGYSGATSCADGAKCTYSNDWYSQCIPDSNKAAMDGGAANGGAANGGSADGGAANGGGYPNPPNPPNPTTTTTTTTLVTTTSTTTTTPPATPTGAGSSAPPPSGGSGNATGSSAGNPFAGKQIYANPNYADEITTNAVPALTGALASAAAAVAKVGTFFWLDTLSKVPVMDEYLTNIDGLNKAGANPPIMGAFVVYDLPDRDCAALASNGEYSIANKGLENYYAYIDAIAAVIKKHPDTPIALIIEPDSLANLVTNLNVAKCSGAQDAYETGVIYAIKTLNFPNVVMYLDAGHSGWLGWAANQAPAVSLFSKLYTSAGKPSSVRGLVTNVANYNAFSISTCPSYTGGNPICDEQKYINAMAPQLTAAGFPAHFLTDTGRNGVQPTQQAQEGDWCNVIGTGFGVRPTTDTGNPNVDAFVWVKPGGESDGTSNTTSSRYDAHCGYADALKPAPEAGSWFNDYFIQLLKNANPPFS